MGGCWKGPRAVGAFNAEKVVVFGTKPSSHRRVVDVNHDEFSEILFEPCRSVATAPRSGNAKLTDRDSSRA